MSTLLQVLAMLEAFAREFGPAVEPMVIARMEAIKARATNPAEVALIDAAEAFVRSYLGPAAAPSADA